MDIRTVKKLIELIDNTGVNEIEIKEGDDSVRITRKLPQPQAAPQQVFYQPQQDMPKTEPTPQEAPKAAQAPAPAPQEEESPLSGHIVTSPMVGTMYTSPSPTTDAFVSVGQRVEKGDVLCIVEAMKMFNQIESDVAGVIKAIVVENGTPVEFGQPLLIIDTH